MPLHETKWCPRCSESFQCKTGSIAQCDCTRIVLSEEVKAFIAANYVDCLSVPCLKDLSITRIIKGERLKESCELNCMMKALPSPAW